jgi:putative transcriptional regulator
MKNNIKQLRKQLGYRQEDIATMLGVTRQTINAIENEKYNPTLELAMNLSKLLKTTVEKLFILEKNTMS